MQTCTIRSFKYAHTLFAYACYVLIAHILFSHFPVYFIDHADPKVVKYQSLLLLITSWNVIVVLEAFRAAYLRSLPFRLSFQLACPFCFILRPFRRRFTCCPLFCKVTFRLENFPVSGFSYPSLLKQIAVDIYKSVANLNIG